MANQKNSGFRTRAVVNKIGDKKVLSVLSARVVNVNDENGKMISLKGFKREDFEAINGKAPVVVETKNGNKASSFQIELINDVNSINFGEEKGVDTTPNANGDVVTNVTVRVYRNAISDMERCVRIGERISILNAELTINEAGYAELTVNGYGQIGTAKVSKKSEDSEGTAEAPKTTAKKQTVEKAEEQETEAIPVEDDPFAEFDE